MKILLDESAPHKLIKAAEVAGFDVLFTSDPGIPHQQNMTGLKPALAVLSTSDWNVVKTLMSIG